MLYRDARVISEGMQSEIPCSFCEYGHFTSYCHTEADGEPYHVLVCQDCGQWDFHSRYVESCLIVQDHAGILLCEWKVCAQTGLQYMVRLQNPDVNMDTVFWDNMTIWYMSAGDDRGVLCEVLIKMASRFDLVSEYQNIHEMSVAEMKQDIEDFIDMYMGEQA